MPLAHDQHLSSSALCETTARAQQHFWISCGWRRLPTCVCCDQRSDSCLELLVPMAELRHGQWRMCPFQVSPVQFEIWRGRQAGSSWQEPMTMAECCSLGSARLRAERQSRPPVSCALPSHSTSTVTTTRFEETLLISALLVLPGDCRNCRARSLISVHAAASRMLQAGVRLMSSCHEAQSLTTVAYLTHGSMHEQHESPFRQSRKTRPVKLESSDVLGGCISPAGSRGQAHPELFHR